MGGREWGGALAAAALLWGTRGLAAQPICASALAEEKAHFERAEALDLVAQLKRWRAMSQGDAARARLLSEADRADAGARVERRLAAQAAARVFPAVTASAERP